MTTRRSFCKTALLGGAAFAAGLKLGAPAAAEARDVTLHGFVPADEAAVRRLVSVFLSSERGRLPVPVVDAPASWRPTVAEALRPDAARFGRHARRLFEVQVLPLEAPLPADLMLQRDARVLDPTERFDGELLAMREDLRGRAAAVAVTCRLAPRPEALAADRVLVVETASGVQERIALAGDERTLTLGGPAGGATVAVGAAGARVVKAGCRHETCRRQGAIDRPGQLVACAPNRLVLRIETV